MFNSSNTLLNNILYWLFAVSLDIFILYYGVCLNCGCCVLVLCALGCALLCVQLECTVCTIGLYSVYNWNVQCVQLECTVCTIGMYNGFSAFLRITVTPRIICTITMYSVYNWNVQCVQLECTVYTIEMSWFSGVF